MHPSFLFAVDGGASKTEVVLCTAAGATLAAARVGPCNLYQDPDGGVAAILSGLAQCCASVGWASEAVMARSIISAGLAGLSGPGTQALFHRRFAGFARRLLSSDGYIGLVGGFGPQPGAMVSVGTGVVGCRFDASGRFLQLGGWGFPVGDLGGGAWLGLQAVAAWLEHRDGVARRPESQALWDGLAAALGDDRAAILASVRGVSPACYAAQVPLVLEAAAGGDAFAGGLLDAAAGHLAALGVALGSPRLAVGGGLGRRLAPQIARALAGSGTALDLEIVPDPLAGAVAIARGERPAEFAADS